MNMIHLGKRCLLPLVCCGLHINTSGGFVDPFLQSAISDVSANETLTSIGLLQQNFTNIVWCNPVIANKGIAYGDS
jgi:hypothetical protein